jgi:hypothetical protein
VIIKGNYKRYILVWTYHDHGSFSWINSERFVGFAVTVIVALIVNIYFVEIYITD